MLLLILSVLQSLFTAVEQHPVEADINLTIAEQASQPFSYNGHALVFGTRFTGEIMGYEMAYDGTTLSIWAEDTGELTLSTPSESELMEVNPFLLAREIYKVSRETERIAPDGNSAVITLTPAEGAPAPQGKTPTRVVVRVKRDGERWSPVAIELHEGTKVTTLTLSNVRWLATAPAFTLNHPDAYVNDMRLPIHK